MRRRFGLAVGLIFVGASTLHCVGDDPAVTGSTSDGGNDGDTTSGDGSPSDAAADGASGITVNGTLNGGNPTAPLANRKVVLIDQADTVFNLTTGSDGIFHAADVAAPYDIIVPYNLPDGGAYSNPEYFAGVTRTDPVVYGATDFSGVDETQHNATINFVANTPTGSTIWASGPNTYNTFAGASVSTSYNLAYAWFGASTTYSTPLHFYFQNAAGQFTSHVDMTGVALTDTQTKMLSSIGLGTTIPTNPQLTVTATLPGGYTYDYTRYAFYDADNSRVAVADINTLTSHYYVPAVANVLVVVDAGGKTADNTQIGAETSYADYTAVPGTLDVSLIAAPTMLTPADAATGITDTQSVTWTAMSMPCMYTVEVGTNTGLDLSFMSSSPQLDLSRLAKAGILLGSGVTYSWHVSAKTSIASVDDYVKPGGPTPVAPGTTWYSAYTKYETFTTK